jgi:hypothetical protein
MSTANTPSENALTRSGLVFRATTATSRRAGLSWNPPGGRFAQHLVGVQATINAVWDDRLTGLEP